MKIEKFILEEIKNVKGESIKATANINHGNDGFYFTLDTKTIQTILTFAHDENLGRLKSLAWGEIRKMIEDGDVESINDYIARIVSVIVNESSAYNINARFDNEFNSYKTYEIIELFYKFVEFTSKKFNCFSEKNYYF